MKSPLDSHSEAPPLPPPPPSSAVPSAAPASQHASASRVCGVSIIHLSSRARLALISFSFVVVWIAHDVLQELITKTPGLPRIGLVLTASELLACILLPWLVSQRAAAADGVVPFAFVHALSDFVRMALRRILRVVCSGGGAEERACVASILAALRLKTESSAPASALPAPTADGQVAAAVSIAVLGHPSSASAADDGSALLSSPQAATSTELDFHFSHLLTKPLPAYASLRLHRAIWAGRLAVAAVLLLVSIATAVSSLAHVGFPLKVVFKRLVLL
jgi:hypothetical protein